MLQKVESLRLGAETEARRHCAAVGQGLTFLNNRTSKQTTKLTHPFLQATFAWEQRKLRLTFELMKQRLKERQRTEAWLLEKSVEKRKALLLSKFFMVSVQLSLLCLTGTLQSDFNAL